MKAYFATFIFVVLMGCAPSITVNSDFNKDLNFNQFHTFAMSDLEEKHDPAFPMFDNELNRQRIKAAIQSEMMAKGFLLDEAHPHVLVDYHIVIKDKTTIDSYHTQEPGFWNSFEVEVFDYTEGTLVVHLVDQTNLQLIWQGSASSLIRTQGGKPEQRINKAVSLIFETYPGLP